MKTGLIIVGAVLAAVALCDARSPPRPQVCTADWKPVCGVDNKTYGNVCMAKAKYVDIYIYILIIKDSKLKIETIKIEYNNHFEV